MTIHQANLRILLDRFYHLELALWAESLADAKSDHELALVLPKGDNIMFHLHWHRLDELIRLFGVVKLGLFSGFLARSRNEKFWRTMSAIENNPRLQVGNNFSWLKELDQQLDALKKNKNDIDKFLEYLEIHHRLLADFEGGALFQFLCVARPESSELEGFLFHLANRKAFFGRALREPEDLDQLGRALKEFGAFMVFWEDAAAATYRRRRIDPRQPASGGFGPLLQSVFEFSIAPYREVMAARLQMSLVCFLRWKLYADETAAPGAIRRYVRGAVESLRHARIFTDEMERGILSEVENAQFVMRHRSAEEMVNLTDQ